MQGRQLGENPLGSLRGRTGQGENETKWEWKEGKGTYGKLRNDVRGARKTSRRGREKAGRLVAS